MLYINAHVWGIQPSEFWAMTFAEWWCIYDHFKRTTPGRYAGNLTEDDVNELLDLLEADDGTA